MGTKLFCKIICLDSEWWGHSDQTSSSRILNQGYVTVHDGSLGPSAAPTFEDALDEEDTPLESEPFENRTPKNKEAHKDYVLVREVATQTWKPTGR